LPRVGAFEPAEAEPLFRHQPVAGLVGRLHRGDHVALADPRQVGAINDLRMLDPPAAVETIFRVQPLVRADDLRIGCIADGVRRNLKTARCRIIRERA